MFNAVEQAGYEAEVPSQAGTRWLADRKSAKEAYTG